MQLKHGSLFSGIGGFDLAAEWSGWENVFHCEWKEFNQKILKYYWPEAISYHDITKSDFTIHRGTIDVLTGGFPCQPYSVAGKRKGKEDDRHLWPEMLRAIREIQPRWVVGENVGGLVNWNGGLVFDEVQADLEAEGYEVLPFILPACAVNAPHRRDRIWFIAYRNIGTAGSSRENREVESHRGKNNDEQSGRGIEGQQNIGCGELLRTFTNTESQGGERLPIGKNEKSTVHGIENGDAADTNSSGFQTPRPELKTTGIKQYGKLDGASTNANIILERDLSRNETHIWGKYSQKPNNSNISISGDATDTQRTGQQRQGRPERQVRSESFGEGKASWSYDDGGWPTQPPLCNGNDGLSSRLDGITFPKWRNESIMSGGNAIVPQVALEIFKVINQMENI